MALRLVPTTLKAAGRFVAINHRHNRAPHGALFAVGAADDAAIEVIVGVAIIGRPVARRLQDGFTCKVVRLCTNGTYNACSLLYGAARRAAKALGYRRILTYTLASEGGASLHAAGFMKVAETIAASWDVPSRRRPNRDLFGTELRPESEDKIRWECQLTMP